MFENYMVMNTPDDDGSERMEELVRFMDDLEGWKQNGGRQTRTCRVIESQYITAGTEYQIIVNLSGWEYNGFTDGDIDGVATGRWKQIDEGESLDELKKALAAEAERLAEMAEEHAEQAAANRLKRIEFAAKELLWALDTFYPDAVTAMTIGPPDNRSESAFLEALRKAVL